jgi:secreted trypsin-like serine protease
MPVPGFSKVENWDKFNSSLLIEVTKDNAVFTCTGVAISDKIIVTAGHCLVGAGIKVRIFVGTTYNPKNPSLEIESFNVHPSYNPMKSNYENDIAKIHMKEKIPSYINLCPIHQGATVTGTIYRFGFGARDKKNIRTVITPSFRQINTLSGVVELNDTFSQSGDSGGPIFVDSGKGISVLAIHSTLSSGPQGKYSYNPLLSHYLSWIYQN